MVFTGPIGSRLAEDNLLLSGVETDHRQVGQGIALLIGRDQIVARFRFTGRNESFHFQGKFDRDALVLDPDDFTPGGGSIPIDFGKLVPGVGFHLLVAEGNPPFLGVDIQDDHVHLLAFLHHLTGVTDFFRPGEVADVDQAIDPRFDLDENPEVGDVTDLAAQHRTRGIPLRNLLPGVGHQLLHAQGDLLTFVVDVQDLDFHDLTQGDHLARMFDMLRPTHL